MTAPTPPRLSGCIIARDEADRIERAVRSLAFCDEVVVLDSGSTDGTVEKAEALGARVLRTDWPGHVAQKNRALDASAGEWVLSIDADEWVTPELSAEILAFVATPTASSASMPRRNHWLGHELSHGRWYPDRRVRLARRAGARWTGDDPHDRLENGAVSALHADLHHAPYRTLGEHLATIDRYTATAARSVRPGLAIVDLLVRPTWAFFRAYILELGFRDGAPGLVVAALGAIYVLVKYGRAHGIIPTPITPSRDGAAA